MEKNEFFMKRIRELANISYQRDIVTFSDFLNLNEQNMVNSQNFHSLGVTLKSYGGYENAERQIIGFYPSALSYSREFPIECLCITPVAPRFSENLTHRDYLGAILNLGVDRSVVGDILVEEKKAYVFCLRKISEFFLENLTKIRHTNILVHPVENLEELPKPKQVSVTGICSSVRLDALIALAFHASRSSMVGYIEGGQVFVNGKMITSNGYEPKEGDIISVRGKGRFLYEGVTGQTKKGRYGVTLLLYSS